MGAPNKKPTSPRRVVVRPRAIPQQSHIGTPMSHGDDSPFEKDLVLKRINDLELKLSQGSPWPAGTKSKHAFSLVAGGDDNEYCHNKFKMDTPTGDDIFSDKDLEGMPGLLPRSIDVAEDTEDIETQLRRLEIVKKKQKKKIRQLTPSLGPGGRKQTKKVPRKKIRKLQVATLDEFLDGLEKKPSLKRVLSSSPTTSEEVDFVETLRRAEYWKGQKMRADTRIKHLELQKAQLERRLEHHKSAVLERLAQFVSTSGP